MGFFKDFKEDFSDAVDELIPGGEDTKDLDDVVINTLDGDIDSQSELAKLDGLLEQAKKADEPKTAPVEYTNTPASKANVETEPVKTMNFSAPVSETVAPVASDEKSVITAGMKITGTVETLGSIDIEGEINGDVICNGKLVVTGKITGNSKSAEFFADAAKIEGEVVTVGTAKVGVGSVIIGNVSASSAVIAGAVKGDIDVNGAVVVDTSAVIMGNIKSKSVQINNGAVIEGFCSQSYSDVDVNSIFS